MRRTTQSQRVQKNLQRTNRINYFTPSQHDTRQIVEQEQQMWQEHSAQRQEEEQMWGERYDQTQPLGYTQTREHLTAISF